MLYILKCHKTEKKKEKKKEKRKFALNVPKCQICLKYRYLKKSFSLDASIKKLGGKRFHV